MDTLSHALIGLTLSRLDSTRELGAVAAVTLTTASLLPDIDVVSRVFGHRFYLKHHRGITHGLVVLPLEAVVLAGLLLGFWPEARTVGFTALFSMSLVAMLVHIFFDILTPYGTKVLLPFHNHAVTTDSMPIFEPFLILLTGIGLYLSYHQPGLAHHSAIAVLLLWPAFFAFYGASKLRAEALLTRHAGSGVLDSDTFPVPGMPLVWLCVVRKQKHSETFLVNVLTRKKKHPHFFKHHPFPKALEHNRMAIIFMRFARHFLVEKRVEGRLCHYLIRDLRFDFPYHRKFFHWEITTDQKGRILSERFRL